MTSMQPVGRGNGEFTREKVVVQSGPTLTIDDQRFHLRYNLHKSMLITAAKKFVMLASLLPGEAESGWCEVFDCEPAIYRCDYGS